MSAQIVAWVQFNVPGPSSRKYVLRELADMANDDGWAFGQSEALLAQKVALSQRQVKNLIASLCNAGFLRRFAARGKDGRVQVAFYQVLAPHVNRRAIPQQINVSEIQRKHVDYLSLASGCLHSYPACADCAAKKAI